MNKSILFATAALFAVGAQAAEFTLKSMDIAPNAALTSTQVYNSFGCTGNNMSPQLSWSGAPAGTQSYALTVYDPDAPTGSGWWHWVLIDIPASTTSLPAGAGAADGKAAPQGSRQIRTDFGAPGYGGPCPPTGDKPHRYIFTIYALKIPKLSELPDNATAAFAGYMIHGSLLGQASFTAYYGR